MSSKSRTHILFTRHIKFMVIHAFMGQSRALPFSRVCDRELDSAQSCLYSPNLTQSDEDLYCFIPTNRMRDCSHRARFYGFDRS